MENITLSSIFATLAVAVVAALFGLAAYGIKKISDSATSAIKTKAESVEDATHYDKLLTIVEFIKSTALSVVNELNQTVVDDLKIKSEDGKLTEEEIADIKEKALDTLKYVLEQDVIDELEEFVYDINSYLSAIIEDAVRQVKFNFGMILTGDDVIEGDAIITEDYEPEDDDDEDDMNAIGEDLTDDIPKTEKSNEPIDDTYDDIAEDDAVEEDIVIIGESIEVEVRIEKPVEEVPEIGEPDAAVEEPEYVGEVLSEPIPGLENGLSNDEIVTDVVEEPVENTENIADAGSDLPIIIEEDAPAEEAPKKKTTRKKKTTE